MTLEPAVDAPTQTSPIVLGLIQILQVLLVSIWSLVPSLQHRIWNDVDTDEQVGGKKAQGNDGAHRNQDQPTDTPRQPRLRAAERHVAQRKSKQKNEPIPGKNLDAFLCKFTVLDGEDHKALHEEDGDASDGQHERTSEELFVTLSQIRVLARDE